MATQVKIIQVPTKSIKNKNNHNVKYPVSRNLKSLHNASIFKPIKRGRRRVDVKHNYSYKKSKIAIHMAEELNVADQDLMIGLFAIARSKEFGTLSLDDVAYADGDKTVKDSISLDVSFANSFAMGEIPHSKLRSIQISITKYELLTELGKVLGTGSYEWLSRSLSRLAGTTFHHDGEKWRGSFSMLSYIEDKETGNLLITINPFTSYAIRRDEEGYVLQHRGERNQLKTEEAKVLHSVLCSLVDPNTQKSISLKKLVDKVWCDGEDYWSRMDFKSLVARYKGQEVDNLEAIIAEDPEVRPLDSRDYEVLNGKAADKTIRNRMSIIKKALETEINNLAPWAVQVTGRGDKATVIIRRQKAQKSLLELP